MKKSEYCKLEIVYPDGTIDCHNNVSNTYRKAIEYIGLENMRKLNIKRNSINIISTVEECRTSTGKKKENTSKYNDLNTLIICVQFSTKDKYDHLKKANERYATNLKINLISPYEDKLLIDQEDSEEVKEGLLKKYLLTRYERSPIARRKCLEFYHNRPVCQICGFDFEKVYGKRPNKEPYIEIHHINPLSLISKEKGNHKVNCATDLIPLCSNCHSMIHYYKKDTLQLSELKELFELHNKRRN